MKIATVIRPRADGAVIFAHNGVQYRFVREADGVLACDVADDEAVRAMLATDRFYPLQAADEPAAQALVQHEPQPEPQRRTSRRSKKGEATA